MAIKAAVRTTKLISVHSEPGNPLRLEIPSVTPGTYFVPGVEAPEEQFKRCIFSFKDSAPVQYANLKELDGKKYVEIQVFEGKTPNYGTELDQPQDESGHKMEPPLRRSMMTVLAEDVANELERQATFFDVNIGIRAFDHEPSVDELNKVIQDNLNYMKSNVQLTNRWSKFGQINITEQAQLHAAKLHRMGLLTPLPSWAILNPEGKSIQDTILCPNCGAVLTSSMSKCVQPGCGTIVNWRLAVERGQVLPKDVPKSKRLEAGLDELPKTRQEILQEVREKVAEDFQQGN